MSVFWVLLPSVSPVTNQDLELRYRQVFAVSSIISAVSHADAMAQLCPTAEDPILQAVQGLCSSELPVTEREFADLQVRLFATSMTIGSLAHGHSMRSSVVA